MRCSRVRRFLSGYPAFGFQLSAFDLPARGVLLPIPTRNPFKHLHLQLFLDRDRNHVVTCYLILSHQPGRTALQAAPLRNLCVRRLPRLPRASRGLGHGVGACPELLGALDSSSLGLTLNLQLSTFNRVSFLSPSSPHLCALYVLCGENSSSFRSSLTPRHSPLATNSFIIRTSKTPLPQPLYNPHLRAPLGSAGNKGLITEAGLTVWLFRFNFQLSIEDPDPVGTVNFHSEIPTPSEPSTRYIVIPLKSLG